MLQAWLARSGATTPPPTPPVVAKRTRDADDDTDDTETEYEAQRRQRIEHNNRMLLQLGLVAPSTPRTPKPRAPPRIATPPSAPRRVSARLTGRKVEEEEEEEKEEEVVVQERRAIVSRVPIADAAVPGRTRAMLSGHRHNVYSESVSWDGRLLAAAGAEGLVSVYDLRQALQEEDEPHVLHTPMAVLPLHKRWIADVQFVGGRDDTVLSAADDGVLLLSRLDTARDVEAVPLSRLASPFHTGGIFGMCELQGSVLTASKDTTVGLARVSDDRGGLTAVTKFDEAGTSVVKCAHWQESLGAAHVFACAGNDRVVRLFDVRSASARPSTLLPDVHTMAVNAVAFSPANEFHLISSGFDSAINVWDLRHINAPAAVLSGHHGHGKPPLLHPVFDRSGTHVYTPGTGSTCLHVFDVARGTLDRAIDVRTAPQTMALVPGGPGLPTLLCASSGKNLIQVLRVDY